MSGFIGSTKETSGVNSDVKKLRESMASFLQNKGYEGLFSTGSDEELLKPYRDLFKQQNETGLAQQKESAGNLTGSSFALGQSNYLSKATTQQGAFMSDLLERRKQADQARFAQLLLGLGTAGVGPPTTAYQPGFLDYLMQAGQTVATAYGGRVPAAAASVAGRAAGVPGDRTQGQA